MDNRERQRLIEELRSLTKSLAWQHVCQSLDASALQAAYKMGSGPGDEASNNFTRGAIWGLKTLKELPSNMLLQLENDQAMESLESRGNE